MKTEDAEGGILETWTVDEVADAFARGEITIIDVRTPQEYLLERIPGALLYPMSDFDPATLPASCPKRLVFHCGSGARSGKVARLMLAAGISPVAHLEGGFGAWKAAGRAYLGTDLATGMPKRMGGGS